MNASCIAILVAVGAFVARFLRIGAIENDHYVYLARAHQLLHGDWPVRDFADPGLPLGYLLSATAAAVAGPTLLTEAVLTTAIFAVGVAATFLLARRASGNAVIALAATAIVVVLPPRLYNSAKVLVPAIAMVVAWRYADRPTGRGALGLGAWTGVAFLFRHDYAVYVGTAGAVLLVVQHRREPRELVARASAFLIAAGIVIAPWLLYVQVQQGLPEYFASAARFSLAERSRTVGRWTPLFYAVAALPIAAAVLARRGTRTLATAHVAFACTLALTSDFVLLRDEPLARLPDVYALSVVIAAILGGRFLPAHAPKTMHRTAIVLVVAGMVALLVARPAAVTRGLELVPRWHRVAARLREARPEITPNPGRAPLVAYIERCTGPEDRVLVSGFGPELPVLAHRAFAAGLPTWIRGYYEDEADVARARAQLAREHVGVAVMLDGGNAFAASWPAIAADLHARGLTPAFMPLADERVELWLPPAAARDAETGLPCASGR